MCGGGFFGGLFWWFGVFLGVCLFWLWDLGFFFFCTKQKSV